MNPSCARFILHPGTWDVDGYRQDILCIDGQSEPVYKHWSPPLGWAAGMVDLHQTDLACASFALKGDLMKVKDYELRQMLRSARRERKTSINPLARRYAFYPTTASDNGGWLKQGEFIFFDRNAIPDDLRKLVRRLKESFRR